MSDLISRSALIKKFEDDGLGDYSLLESVFAAGVYAGIENAPTIDAVEVVRCKDCVNSQKLKRCEDQVHCMVWKNNPRTDGYCYLGVKMDGGADNEG